ncbi:unnamed protein product [Heligmosomoides polygyrus]|uniref:Reverse transcriptase domain-containing protein n=1 Tax=Heligmosomoides polygyrus TaxID=6339 RepID=A0A183GUN8_HELPZ|nr:unnamed protein product [Heligmosomoides polygyrus]
MDAITRDLQKPVPWTLLYADDAMLACERKCELERQVHAWCDCLAMLGLKLNVKKTEYLTTDVTRLDRIRNDVIRQKFGIAPMADKMREARMRWYGHVLRGKEDSVREIGLNL